MRLNPKYFHIRPALVFTSLLSVVLLVVWCWALVQHLTSRKDELNKATFILQEAHFRSETEEGWLRDKVHHYVDIDLKDQPYAIRLSDEFHSDAWNKIHEYASGDTIVVFYYAHLFHDSVLNNPSELNINGHSIISYEDTQKEISWVLTATLLGLSLLSLYAFLAYRTYRQLMWEGDKAVYAQSKWLFFKRLFRGN